MTECRSPLELMSAAAFQITVVLFVVWFGTRHRRNEFRFGRVAAVSLLCLASAVPQAAIAYLLWPWDWESWISRTSVLAVAIAPLGTAIVLGLLWVRFRKRTS